MWVQHDLTVDLADTEIAEPSATMDLASGKDCSIVGAHDIPDLCVGITTSTARRSAVCSARQLLSRCFPVIPFLLTLGWPYQ